MLELLSYVKNTLTFSSVHKGIQISFSALYRSHIVHNHFTNVFFNNNMSP